ncbi:cold inducible RNA binding protein a isoform X2 [Limanda limanda]|uniref:cold inducible RNA binding protein a isoform X2 n=1 Tax=Limanda limanda TaxID=27771 RepID=UPI0029C916AC|nr:cold inducible RNA binding protein a isoform X2 [Limanda limanda]
MAGPSALMKRERGVDARGLVLVQHHEVADSQTPGGGADEGTPEVKTISVEAVASMVTEDMGTGATVTEASVVVVVEETGALVAAAAVVATEVADTRQEAAVVAAAATGKIGVRVDMVIALVLTVKDMTAMTGELHIRSGRLFMKLQIAACYSLSKVSSVLNICILNVL